MAMAFPDNTFVAPKEGTGLRLSIAEAPGKEEAVKGEPLVGGAGAVFDSLLRKAGIRRENVTLANVIQCRPPENVFPTDKDARNYISQQDAYRAVQHCIRTHVEPLLKSRPWNRIDLFGDKALRFVGGKDEGIGKWRGSPISVPALGDKIVAVPTLHPAYLMREQIMFPVVVNDLSKSLAVPPEHYTIYPSLEEVKAFKAKTFAFDIETSYANHKEIKMVGLSDGPYHAIVVPFHEPYIAELKRIFAEADTVIGHNCIQFDIPILAENDILLNTADVWDTMLLHHLRFPDLGGDAKGSAGHDLEFVSSMLTNKPAWKHEKSILQLYCARDTDVTFQVYNQLRPLVEQARLTKLYKLVQMPLAMICYMMQKRGIKLDPNNITKVRAELMASMEKQELLLPEEIRAKDVMVRKRQLAPPGTLSEKTKKPIKYIHIEVPERVIPWRSSDVKKAFLYGTTEPWQLGLEPQINPKSGEITTDKTALERLYRRTGNKAISALRQLTKSEKLLSSFCTEDMGTKITRLHTHFNVHGTASGRLSSSDPNLQNIPESMRYMYIPSKKGSCMVEFDFSQIENRLTAHFAHDTERLARFTTIPNYSEHKYAASLFLDIPYEEVEKSSDPDSAYIKAKKIVHGTNYGEGARKIALMNDLKEAEVKALLNKWKNAIRATIDWQTRCTAQAKRDGYLTTPFGRKRWFYTDRYYTESLSFLPQSTAADVIFRCMIGLAYERIGWPEDLVALVCPIHIPLPAEVELALQVHDSLLFECPAELVPELVRIVAKVMTQPWAELGGFSIPVACKVSPVGGSWGECEEYSLPEA